MAKAKGALDKTDKAKQYIDTVHTNKANQL
jgi:hypothetical protein